MGREWLSKCQELLAAVCLELKSGGVAPGSCLNALTIAQSVCEGKNNADALKLLFHHGLLGAVANTIRLHSGVKVGLRGKQMRRSAIIEETALKVIDTLIKNVGTAKEGLQAAEGVKKTLVGLQNDLAPHLAPEIGARLASLEQAASRASKVPAVAVC